jgi:hypothetical protein
MILDYFPLVICPNQERDFKFLVWGDWVGEWDPF